MRDEKFIKFVVGKPEGKDQLGETDKNGIII
jgi:hypothetical protein